MKKIKYLVMSLAMAVGFTACQDAYEIEPIGILDDEATFFTVDDAQIYLNGLYGTMVNTTHIGFTSIFTDEVAPSDEWNGSNRETHQMILNSTNGYASAMWLQGHAAVSKVNRLLNAAPNIELQDAAEEEQMADILAQAHFIRAYAYLTLVSYFSPDMTDGNALGVMLYTHVPASNETLPRATNSEMFQLIKDDLVFAMNNIKAHDYIYPTKAAVEALLARMYAFQGDYINAAVHANNVISNYGMSLTVSQPYQANNFYHPANSSNPYRQIWSDIPVGASTQHEQILTLRSLVNGNPAYQPASIYFQNSTRCTGSPLWGMSYRLHDLYTQNANDVRQFAFVDPTSNNNACRDGEIMVDKYPGVPGAQLLNSVKLIRLSEMYFILAEAEAANSNLGGVAAYLNFVREARSIDGTAVLASYANVTEAWADILLERRKEFFAEGYRYVDLRRLGAKANQTIDRHPNDNELASEPTTLPITDHRFTMPIPFDEVSVNPNIVQNPGY